MLKQHGSTRSFRLDRHVERVESCRDVTWRAKWNLGYTEQNTHSIRQFKHNVEQIALEPAVVYSDPPNWKDIQGGPKIGTVVYALITSSNIDQFSNFFSPPESREKFVIVAFTKDPITPLVCRFTHYLVKCQRLANFIRFPIELLFVVL